MNTPNKSYNLIIDRPNEKQKLFLKANNYKHVGFGGARGGGK